MFGAKIFTTNNKWLSGQKTSNPTELQEVANTSQTTQPQSSLFAAGLQEAANTSQTTTTTTSTSSSRRAVTTVATQPNNRSLSLTRENIDLLPKDLESALNIVSK
ncbi:MAG: hypothetical protein KBD37_00750 [Burkholderiales bacterium]|nr:hypothetical protein [Burkholderiales bacterium]